MEQTDRRLQEWSQQVLGDVDIDFDAPAAPAGAAGRSRVSLYLLALAPLPPTRGRAPSPFQVGLHYLVTVTDADTVKSHELLARLLFAAMGNPDFELDLAALPAAAWAAFGIAPRPGFVIQVALRQPRDEKPAPMVEHALVIDTAPMARIEGVVLGPQDHPIMGAQVRLPALGRAASTDERGRFEFEGVPAGARLRLLVEAKGWRQEFVAGSGSALQLRLS